MFNKLCYGLGIRRVYDLWLLISHSMKQRGEAQGAPRWRLPDPGWVKANTDAAFQVNGNNGATTCMYISFVITRELSGRRKRVGMRGS